LKLTYDDLRRIPEDDPYRHELYDGMHVSSPSPVKRHQDVVMELSVQLYRGIQEAGLGRVYSAPFDVELSPSDVFEPDVIVILNRSRHILTETHVVGTPDLIVEVLSPATERRDRGVKRERYERFGVPEYWIVDPGRRRIEVYRYDRSTRRFTQPAASEALESAGGLARGDSSSPAQRRVTFDADGRPVEIDVEALFAE
jgi:Uma2 family endonuclease